MTDVFRDARLIHRCRRAIPNATLEQTLRGIRKYVVAADSNDTQVTIIDLQQKLTSNLLDVDMGSGLQESSQ